MLTEPTPPCYGVVFVTAASQAEAEAIAHALIHEHLAACVSLMPIHSLYQWQGEVHQQHEWQLMVKTDLNHFSVLENRIQELHSYEVPEIIALPILQGSAAYLQWITTQVSH